MPIRLTDEELLKGIIGAIGLLDSLSVAGCQRVYFHAEPS